MSSMNVFESPVFLITVLVILIAIVESLWHSTTLATKEKEETAIHDDNEVWAEEFKEAWKKVAEEHSDLLKKISKDD